MRHTTRLGLAVLKLRVIGIRWALYPRFHQPDTDPRVQQIRNRMRRLARRSLAHA